MAVNSNGIIISQLDQASSLNDGNIMPVIQEKMADGKAVKETRKTTLGAIKNFFLIAVPAWAKAAQKPSYTAAEVGAATQSEAAAAADNALNNAKAYTNTKLTDYLTEEETNLLLQERIRSLLVDKGAVSGRSELPEEADNFDSYMIEAEEIIVFAYNGSSGIAWLPLGFFVDMGLYETVSGATEKMEAAVVEASAYTDTKVAHESQLRNEAIEAEADARQTADNDIWATISSLTPDVENIQGLPGMVAAEAQERQEADQALQEAIDSKAPLESPTFTGTPKVPSKTTAAANNGTLIATEAQVKAGPVTLTVGTSGNVDYLCTGTNDHLKINAAIAALPSGGGKIAIREGTYNLGGSVNVNKNNVTIQGMGPSTVLNVTATIASEHSGAVNVTASYCRIAGLKITNSPGADLANGIHIGGGSNAAVNNVISGNICSNSNADSPSYGGSKTSAGISVEVPYNVVAGNICSNSGVYGSYGIYLDSSNCKVTGNDCSNSSPYENCGIKINYAGSASDNVISGNICSNSASGSAGKSYGIHMSGGSASDNVISGNICSNSASGSAGKSYGIYINAARGIVSNNAIANKMASGQSASNTFALHVASDAHYCAVHGNNLRGVTGASGAAYTADGNTEAAIPGSATAAGALNTGGSCGFNIV